MAIAVESKLFGINDLKISKLTADSASAHTYDAAKDVPGAVSLKVTPSFSEKTLKGDEAILDQYTKLETVEWSFENALMSLDVLAILVGGTVTAGGVTPNQTQTYALTTSDTPAYFKMEGKTDYSSIGDVHIVLYKCKCSKLDYELVGDDFAKVSASGKAIGLLHGGGIKDIVFNETAVAISTAAGDSTAPTVTITPADAATGIVVSSNMTWLFSEAIKASCVTASNFMVIKATDGTLVAGVLTLSSDQLTVTFNPDSDLGAATAYIMIATTNVMDLNGNRLAANSIGNFTTV